MEQSENSLDSLMGALRALLAAGGSIVMVMETPGPGAPAAGLPPLIVPGPRGEEYYALAITPHQELDRHLLIRMELGAAIRHILRDESAAGLCLDPWDALPCFLNRHQLRALLKKREGPPA
ncbi:MAG TPA: hypothetical protein PLR12_04540 [Clostridia bacterium]|nr:hypothetical protein [Clostridia bacterium]